MRMSCASWLAKQQSIEELQSPVAAIRFQSNSAHIEALDGRAYHSFASIHEGQACLCGQRYMVRVNVVLNLVDYPMAVCQGAPMASGGGVRMEVRDEYIPSR